MGRTRAYGSTSTTPFRVHPAVSRALADGQPVVALESTIITHGMPYPHNLNTALEVEAIVQAQGATPATVGVVRGRVHVGLSPDDLEDLARGDREASLKISRRDLPYAISQGLSGGTTVSGTMIAAHRVGIPVFVTGGIGGVHRGGEHSLDISADLTELGRTPVAVISAGVKSILDIGRTLEFLETQGVCVATYGQSNNFPAFFSPQSGFTSPYHVRDPEEAAKLIEGTLSLGLQSGLLIAVPICEEHAAVGQLIDDAIRTAVAEARLRHDRARKQPTSQRVRKSPESLSEITNPGSVCQSFGGVGRNIADSLSRLGHRGLFISAIGTDSHSEAVLNYCQHMNTSGIARLGDQKTATYCAVITQGGDYSLGLGDMDIHQHITEQYVSSFEKQLSSASLVCLDGNLPVSTIDYVCARAKELAVSILPSSLEDVLACALALSRPLLEHLCCLIVTLGSHGVLMCGLHDGNDSVDLRPRAGGRTRGRLCALHYAALPVTTEIVNVSGAGDSLAGGIMAGVLQGRDTDSCVRMGLLAARLSLATRHPINPLLCMDSVDPRKILSQAWPKPRFLWID
ncbi:hypothetical protein CRUP_021791 [Coryphaenoides rupestris]|nr:hypothetical protein CRUP_021791 [Coryphaenoides rupestris]